MLRVRNEAKMNMRRFVDDVAFVVGKESRDRLKGIQRQLRDHYREHRQPDHPLAQRVAAGDAGRGQARGERAQHPGRANSSVSSTSCGQVTDHANKLAAADSVAPQPVAAADPRANPISGARPGE